MTVTAPGALTMTSTGVRQVQVTSPVITAGGTVHGGGGADGQCVCVLERRAAWRRGRDDYRGDGGAARAGAPLAHRDRGRDAIDHRPSEQRPDLDPVLRARAGEHDWIVDDHADRRAVHERLAHGRCRTTRRRDSQPEGSYTNLSADDTDVYVQVGITHPTYNNAQLWQVQNVRAGSAGFEVTLTNSRSTSRGSARMSRRRLAARSARW